MAAAGALPYMQRMNTDHEPPSVLEPLEDHPKYQKVC